MGHAKGIFRWRTIAKNITDTRLEDNLFHLFLWGFYFYFIFSFTLFSFSFSREKKKGGENPKKRCVLECSLYEKTEVGKQPTIFIACSGNSMHSFFLFHTQVTFSFLILNWKSHSLLFVQHIKCGHSNFLRICLEGW